MYTLVPEFKAVMPVFLLQSNTQMQLNIPPKDSSVAAQQQAGLNQDIRWDINKGEREILREKK